MNNGRDLHELVERLSGSLLDYGSIPGNEGATILLIEEILRQLADFKVAHDFIKRSATPGATLGQDAAATSMPHTGKRKRDIEISVGHVANSGTGSADGHGDSIKDEEDDSENHVDRECMLDIERGTATVAQVVKFVIDRHGPRHDIADGPLNAIKAPHKDMPWPVIAVGVPCSPQVPRELLAEWQLLLQYQAQKVKRDKPELKLTTKHIHAFVETMFGAYSTRGLVQLRRYLKPGAEVTTLDTSPGSFQSIATAAPDLVRGHLQKAAIIIERIKVTQKPHADTMIAVQILDIVDWYQRELADIASIKEEDETEGSFYMLIKDTIPKGHKQESARQRYGKYYRSLFAHNGGKAHLNSLFRLRTCARVWTEFVYLLGYTPLFLFSRSSVVNL